MSYEIDKILGRIDECYKCSDDMPQAKPEQIEKQEYDKGSIEFLEFWSNLDERRKSRDLESSKKVQEILRTAKKQVLEDQAELMERFREALTF